MVEQRLQLEDEQPEIEDERKRVATYLVHHGYSKTAEIFARSAGQEPGAGGAGERPKAAGPGEVSNSAAGTASTLLPTRLSARFALCGLELHRATSLMRPLRRLDPTMRFALREVRLSGSLLVRKFACQEARSPRGLPTQETRSPRRFAHQKVKIEVKEPAKEMTPAKEAVKEQEPVKQDQLRVSTELCSRTPCTSQPLPGGDQQESRNRGVW